MKKTNYFEIIGVLSLSLILTSTMSVSACLPDMLEYYSSYSRSSVELLLSVPAFAMMLMIVSSPIIAKYVPERIVVSAGLLIFSIAGLTPVFFQSYPVLFASRILLGIGNGLINAKAITMIGQRFTGELQQKLQGIRCSMETLGQASMTLIGGQLLIFGWKYTFLIYGVALFILIIYLFFVPYRKDTPVKKAGAEDEREKKADKISGDQWSFIISRGLLGFLMVSTNVSLSLRMPSYLIEKGIGTAVDGSTILSISIFAGFLGGILFGYLVKAMKKILLPFSLFLGGTGMIIILAGGNMMVVALGASMCGFCVTLCTSIIFGGLPEYLPAESLATGNAFVLVGCNLGAFTAPFVLNAIDVINPEISFGFMTYGIVFFVLAAAVLMKQKTAERKNVWVVAEKYTRDL